MAARPRDKASRRNDSPSTRTSARQHARAAASRSKAAKDDAALSGSQTQTQPKGLRINRLTRRAFMVVALVVGLTISYFYALHGLILQERQIAETRQRIAEHEQNIRTLEEEVARWQDDEFVRMQARERLGWVVPGETGFRVIGADGEPYAGGQQIGVEDPAETDATSTWWNRMWSSVQTADDPLAAEGP